MIAVPLSLIWVECTWIRTTAPCPLSSDLDTLLKYRIAGLQWEYLKLPPREILL